MAENTWIDTKLEQKKNWLKYAMKCVRWIIFDDWWWKYKKKLNEIKYLGVMPDSKVTFKVNF